MKLGYLCRSKSARGAAELQSALFRLPPPSAAVSFLIGTFFFLTSGVHPNDTTQSSVGSFLKTCPIQSHLLRLTPQLMFSVTAISELSCSGNVPAICS